MMGECYGVWLQVRLVRFKRAIAKDVAVLSLQNVSLAYYVKFQGVHMNHEPSFGDLKIMAAMKESRNITG